MMKRVQKISNIVRNQQNNKREIKLLLKLQIKGIGTTKHVTYYQKLYVLVREWYTNKYIEKKAKRVTK